MLYKKEVETSYQLLQFDDQTPTNQFQYPISTVNIMRPNFVKHFSILHDGKSFTLTILALENSVIDEVETKISSKTSEKNNKMFCYLQGHILYFLFML